MRSFSLFNAALAGDEVKEADADRLAALATWGYLLVRPGMEFVRQRSNFILGWQAASVAAAAVTSGAASGAVGQAGVPPLGSWMILPELTSPATQTVLPSNDALYGATHLELDLLGPVVAHIPAAFEDRYFSVALMDAHLNNITHFGPRWTGRDAVDALIVPTGWDGTAPAGMSVVQSPTVSVCLYNRMLAGYEDGDLDRVRAWQSGLKLTQLAHWGQPDTQAEDVDTTDFVHPDINTLTDSFAYFEMGLEHLRRNPLVDQAGWLCDLVSSAGFAAAADDPTLAQAVERGVDAATRMLDATLTTWPRHHGWMLPDPTLGLPNSQVLRSAAFQQFQIGSNDISESAYYFTDTDAAGTLLDCGAGRAYDLRFPGTALPPIEAGGYWSLTMYDERSLLVANPINRYATRPDRPGFRRDPDGGASIIVSAHLPQGDADREANWLPAPAGRFRLGLRVYYPDRTVASGDWTPPAVGLRTS